MIPTCPHADAVDDYVTTGRTNRDVEGHLAVCDECRVLEGELRDERLLFVARARLVPPPPPDVVDAILCDAERARTSRWSSVTRGARSLAAVTACAAAVVFVTKIEAVRVTPLTTASETERAAADGEIACAVPASGFVPSGSLQCDVTSAARTAFADAPMTKNTTICEDSATSSFSRQ
jgi:hypothetical protein